MTMKKLKKLIMQISEIDDVVIADFSYDKTKEESSTKEINGWTRSR